MIDRDSICDGFLISQMSSIRLMVKEVMRVADVEIVFPDGVDLLISWNVSSTKELYDFENEAKYKADMRSSN
jgi:hypothetical protein